MNSETTIAHRVASLVAATALALVVALALAGGASAASYSVTDTTDAALVNPAGTSCVSTHGGACTLRAAVQAADNAGGASTITVPAGIYRLSLASTSADDPANGDLDIKGTSTAVTIDGAGASATVIDANHIDRAFAVQAGESLALSGVTVENGASVEGAGRASTGWGYGGAVYNEGTLLIEGSRVKNSASIESGGAIYAGYGARSTSIVDSEATGNASDLYGGVILAYGTGSIALSGDTVTGNVSYDDGGAVAAQGTGPVTITASDISDNAAHKEGGGALAFYDTSSLTISHSTLNDDNAGEYTGGAILAYSASSITVEDSTLSGDSAYEAAAIYAAGTGPISIQRSTLSEDGSDEDGTVYASATGRVTIGNSTLAGDGDGTCGALCLVSSDLTLSGSTFRHDSSYEGPAVELKGSSATAEESIATSTFADNHANDDSGGAIFDQRGDLQIAASTFSGNSAEYGGALTYGSGDGLTLIDDTFDGNTAPLGGGAIYLEQAAEGEAQIVLLNDTIARNTSLAGALYKPERAAVIENTIVAGNFGSPSAGGGADCYGETPTDNAATADKGGNIDSDGTCFSEGVNGDQSGVNALLGPLASNGGPTETDALLAGSPAIGNAVQEPLACPSTDQRGVGRSGLCDIGAYQTVPSPGPLSAPAAAVAENAGAITRPPRAAARPCRSARTQRIDWKVYPGVHLNRIVVTRAGKTYRTLAGSARKVEVSMVGLPRGAVLVRITGITDKGKRYTLGRMFHLCVASRAGAKAGNDYLTHR